MNLSFIKLDINILNDTKIKLIRKMPDGDSLFVLWVGILCLAMKSDTPGIVEISDGIPFTDEALAAELDMNLNTLRMGLEIFQNYKMIEIWNDGKIYAINYNKHQEIDKIMGNKENNRIRQKAYRDRLKNKPLEIETKEKQENEKRNSNVTVTLYKRNATDKDKDIDIDKEKNKENICPDKKNKVEKHLSDSNESGQKKDYIPDPEILNFVSGFQNAIKKELGNLAPDITEELIINGCKTIDKLIRKDKFDKSTVFETIRWAYKDDFWSNQVRSIAHIRKKSEKNGLSKFQNIVNSMQKLPVIVNQKQQQPGYDCPTLA